MTDLRPLVIVGIGGGMEQWRVTKPGTGEPETFVLDYDREGQVGDELTDFADQIVDALIRLAEHNDPSDSMTVMRMAQSVKKYRDLAESLEPAGRYR